MAAGLSTERGAQIAAVTVLEIPLDLPLGVELPEEEERANRELDEARAIGDSYGVSVIPRLVRGRNAGAEIVRELNDTDYGSREYSAKDAEGHHWSFGTYRPAV